MNLDSETGQRLYIRLVKLMDLFLLTAIFAPVWGYCYAEKMTSPFFHWGNYVIVGLFFIINYLITKLYKGYALHLSRISDLVYSQTLATLIADGILYVIMTLVNRSFMSPLPLLLAFAAQSIIIIAWSLAAHRWYLSIHPPLKAVLVCDEYRMNVDHVMRSYHMDAHFKVTHVIDAGNALDNIHVSLIREAEAVFICGAHSHERNIIVKYCVSQNIPCYVIPRIGDVIMSGAEKIHLFHLPMLLVHRYGPTPEYLFIKRIMDIALSLVAVIFFSPFMAIVAVAIKATDGGSIFYRQRRVTKDRKEFDVLKFRSMRMDAEKDGVARLSTGENDPRITKVGRIIRAIRFDELPQLLNILQGDMSIVGPRPERPEISRQYEKDIPEWPLRLQCKCGLTGYAQVYGQYNTTPYDKLLMDLMYIANPSIVEDIKIIFGTVKILFMKESTAGVAEGQTTAAGKK